MKRNRIFTAILAALLAATTVLLCSCGTAISGITGTTENTSGSDETANGTTGSGDTAAGELPPEPGTGDFPGGPGGQPGGNPGGPGGQPGGPGGNPGGQPGGNPGGGPGGNQTATAPTLTDETLSDEARAAVGEIAEGGTSVPAGATHITGKYTVTEPGAYYVDGTISGKKITIDSEGVTLYLVGATLSNEKKVIESNYSFTLTLIGDNTVTNSNESGSNAIDCTGTLTINGTGSLTVSSTKNAIVADSLLIRDATLNITAAKDGLHAEISSYDEDTVTTAPTFSYTDGGYVVIDGANVTIVSASDGIQADTFVYLTGGAVIDITAGGGAPAKVTESSSDNAEGKGIKVGAIDWGAEDTDGDRTDLEDGDYLILIDNATVTINANDDAVHSDGTVLLYGGTLTLASGDDGVHADKLLKVSDGVTVTVTKCYEGLEAAKVEITGGTIAVTASDDGINAADGTDNPVNVANSNCHILITGGDITVDAGGDGLDSNGVLCIKGGKVRVSGSTSGADSALDADGGILLDGGYVFAVGSVGMLESPAGNSAQLSAVLSSVNGISAGTKLTVTDESGNELFSFTVPKAGQAVIFSAPELTSGTTYRLVANGTVLTTFTAGTR